MQLNEFKKPSGKVITSHNYLVFVPNELPPVIEYDESLSLLLSEANLQLGKLSGIGQLVPNPHLLITPYLIYEAVLSSRIEGTQASILDVFNYNVDPETKDSKIDNESKRTVEVVNYVKALRYCLSRVENGKNIDIEMLTNAHKILMTNVRGQELSPGRVRKLQNYIGSRIGIQYARYVPPPPEYLEGLLKSLEKFINSPPGLIPPLVQCALIHYMFEAIHPFGDGNGRIGRLLISLFFAHRKLLDEPLLYLSAYFERNRIEYYSLLLGVSQNSDWIRWIRFFLIAVITQANDAVNNIQKLLSLKEKYKQKLDAKNVSRTTSILVDQLFVNPIITIPSVGKSLNLSYNGAKSNIDLLKDIRILTDYNSKQRGKKYVAYEIIKILSH